MKKYICLLCAFSIMLATLCGCSGQGVQLSGEEIYSKIVESTVEVAAESDYILSLGTGFYIDDTGTVVTNYHVIEGCTSASVITNDGGTYEVTSVLGYSKELDVAILSTTRKNSNPAELADKPVATGEAVYALGSSLGLTGTFSEGMVSAAERKVDGVTYIQITTPISSGNSGGPLVNVQGQVVGITSAGFTDGQNLNLAIPISVLNQISRDNPLSMEEFYYASAEKTITVALEEDFAPYSFEVDGVYYGIHVDIANELARRLGWVVQFEPASFEELIDGVDSGKFDMAFGLEVTPEREELVSFTDPYYDGMAAIFNADSFEEFSNVKHRMAEMIADGTIDAIIEYYSEYLEVEASYVGVRTISLGDKFTAEYILAKWQGGNATEESMIEIMNEYGAEQGGGQLYVIERGDFIEEIDDWCFASNRRVGDVAIIENYYGFSICYISSIE